MKKEKMTDDKILAFINNKADRAMNRQGGGVSENRKTSFDYYIGEKYGNEVPGQSEIVTREVLEVVEWGLAQILPAFTASDKIVSFDPVGRGDEEAAKQETEVINHLLTKKNNGFMFLYEWFKDALMYPNGYARIYIEEREKRERQSWEGLTGDQLLALLSEYESYDSYEIVEQESSMHLDAASGINYELFFITLESVRMEKVLRTETIPGEEMLVDNDLTSIDMDEADFLCHRCKRSKSSLIEFGIDPKLLENVSNEDYNDWNDERVNRLYFEEESPDSGADDDESMEEFWVYDCYVMMDINGDGVAERRHIMTIGNTIVLNEEDDNQPFVALSSIPIPHKHNGLSQTDIVKDLQLIKSSLWRQYLTNIYKINFPKKYVGDRFRDKEFDTLSYLLDPESEYVPCLDPTALVEERPTDLGSYIMPAIQGVDSMIDTRTGINEMSALDPNVLKNMNEEAANILSTSKSKRIEAIIRIFAETGVKQLMIKAHKLLREFQDVPLTLMIRNKWIDVNPAKWKERADMTINVGLGTNDQSRNISMLNNILGLQAQVKDYGLATPKNAYNALYELVDAMGFKDASLFFKEPPENPPPPPPPPPDPQIEMAKKQLQLAEMEQKRRDAETQARLQRDAQELQSKQQLEMMGLQHKQQMESLSAQLEQGKQAVLNKKELAATEKIYTESDLNRVKTDEVIVGIEAQEVEIDVVKNQMRANNGQAESPNNDE